MCVRAMLQAMQQAVQTAPSLSPARFVSLLAALTSPAPKPAQGWNDDDLEDDVAILSYERALNTHSRYKSSGATDRLFPPVSDPEPFQRPEALSSAKGLCAKTAASPTAPAWIEPSEVEARPDFSSALEQNRKCASITIRLSSTECMQLRRRAAEAGLTVSAYLRSCTFEAEALRTQVKETLAELRKATAGDKRTAQIESRQSWLGWLARLLPHWNPNERMARA